MRTAEIKKVGGGTVNRRTAPGCEERNENERDTQNTHKQKQGWAG